MHGGGVGGVAAEAFAEVEGGAFEHALPLVDEDGEQSAAEHDVLGAGLEFLRADGAVEDGVGGAVGGLQGAHRVAGDGEGGESGEGGEGEVEVREARAVRDRGEGLQVCWVGVGVDGVLAAGAAVEAFGAVAVDYGQRDVGVGEVGPEGVVCWVGGGVDVVVRRSSRLV